MPYSLFYFAFATIRASSPPESESKTMLAILLLFVGTLLSVFVLLSLILAFAWS